jgi:histone H3/H4
MPPKLKKKSKTNGLTINVRTLCKSLTNMNVSGDVMYELKNYLEDVISPKVMGMAEKYAKAERKTTIQERDYLKARDWINMALGQV